jgi:hypothetical protein
MVGPGSGGSPTNRASKARRILISVPSASFDSDHDNAAVLSKLMVLEANQGVLLQKVAHLEANMSVMQTTQAKLENGIARILDILQR